MAAGMARLGSLSKHAPGRRITFPSILPLFTPPSQPRLEPVQEGEQLASSRTFKPVRPSETLWSTTTLCFAPFCLLAISVKFSGRALPIIAALLVSRVELTACHTGPVGNPLARFGGRR